MYIITIPQSLFFIVDLRKTYNLENNLKIYLIK